MSSLAWKIQRIKAMGLPEIVYRVRQTAQSMMEKRGWGLAMKVPMPRQQFGEPWVELEDVLDVIDAAPYVAAADEILQGRFHVFSLRPVVLPYPPQWHCDPKTGTLAPLVHGKSLDYRDEQIVGDIKYLWEVNRHLELVTLAQAWRMTNDQRYLQGIATYMTSWFEANPYPKGVNWTSSLEHAVRICNWAVAWHMLGGAASPLFSGAAGQRLKSDWLESIYQHLHFISGHFSRYSSANNHLLGEYMGLLIGSITWPCWDSSEGWLSLARQGFEVEALKQNLPDGVNAEQGIWYHHEVADMMLLCGLFSRANGFDFSSSYWSRLEDMIAYIHAMRDSGGNVPMFGDSDDAVMIRFTPGEQDVYQALLTTGALLFDRADFAAKSRELDDKSLWMLGAASQERWAAFEHAGRPTAEQERQFVDGGYSIVGKNLGQPAEIKAIVDAGPLGFTSIAAHGHADALAMVLSVSGREVLIDPGTYAYHTQKKWREYFRGTAAHNTVRIDDQEQSVSGGNFLWTRHASAHCREFEVKDTSTRWLADHDGYMRLKDPVLHSREIVLDKAKSVFTVRDQLQCRKSHGVEVLWHLAEHCQVSLERGKVVIHSGDDRIEIAMPESALNVELVQGRQTPPLGWVSRRFDDKQETTTVRWYGDISGAIELKTTIAIETGTQV